MKNPKIFAAVKCIGLGLGLCLGLGLTAASPAAACQGPQFESRFVLFSAQQQTEIPEGMVQYRVRITPNSLRNVHYRDLIDVHLMADTPQETGKIERATGRLKIVKPVGTSCSSVAVPDPGVYYVVGSLALDQAGNPVQINGGKLFRPQFTSRKAYPDFSEQ